MCIQILLFMFWIFLDDIFGRSVKTRSLQQHWLWIVVKLYQLPFIVCLQFQTIGTLPKPFTSHYISLRLWWSLVINNIQ